jgi:hypothetical protein
MAWQVNIRTSIILYLNLLPFVIATYVLPYDRPLTYAWPLFGPCHSMMYGFHTFFLFNLAKRHRLNFCRDYSRAFHIFLISRKSSFDTTKSAPKQPDETPRRQATIQNTTQLGLQWLKQHNPRPCFFPSISFILDLLSNHYKIVVLILKIISFRNNFNFSLKTFLRDIQFGSRVHMLPQLGPMGLTLPAVFLPGILNTPGPRPWGN